MRIIKLDATDSTNLYLKNLTLSDACRDLTVVITEKQTKGRGQRGALWDTEPGKNLTFSILKKLNGFRISNQFQLNMAVSLAILETLESYRLPQLRVKWPNDILSGTFKICGILIENVLYGGQIKHAIIGIGLNVNQTHFHNLSNASSLKLLLGRHFNLEHLLDDLLDRLVDYLKRLEANETGDLYKAYESRLFMNGKEAIFQRPARETFKGIIQGVSADGLLKVLREGHLLEEFDLKEIKLLY